MSDPAFSGRASDSQHEPNDEVAAWLVYFVVIGACAALSFFGMFSAFAADVCGSQCGKLVDLGFQIAVLGPWVPLPVAFVAMVVLSAKHRPMLWIPFVTAAAAAALSVAGWTMATTAS